MPAARVSATTSEVFTVGAVTFAAGCVVHPPPNPPSLQPPARLLARDAGAQNIGRRDAQYDKERTGNLRTFRVRKFQPKVLTRTSSGSADAQENT